MRTISLNEQLAIGMTVFDAAGDKLGTLVGSDAYVLIVEQGVFFPTDVSVSMAAVVRVDGDGIWLSLTKDGAQREATNDCPPSAALADAAGSSI